MSWTINLSGHSTNDEAESVKVNDLARELLRQAQDLELNPTYGGTSNNVKSLSWAELQALVSGEPEKEE